MDAFILEVWQEDRWVIVAYGTGAQMKSLAKEYEGSSVSINPIISFESLKEA